MPSYLVTLVDNDSAIRAEVVEGDTHEDAAERALNYWPRSDTVRVEAITDRRDFAITNRVTLEELRPNGG